MIVLSPIKYGFYVSYNAGRGMGNVLLLTHCKLLHKLLPCGKSCHKPTFLHNYILDKLRNFSMTPLANYENKILIYTQNQIV